MNQEPMSPSVTSVSGEPPARAVSSLEGTVSDSEALIDSSRPSADVANTTTENVSEEEDVADDESEYEYEDDDDAAFGGFLMEQRHAPSSVASLNQPTKIQDDPNDVIEKKEKWKEPSKEAVNMSLRAEKEKTGGKRRLAQDLYKIMMSDTSEAGFSLEPASEDHMDKWRIKLFQFDEDSNLAKDMLVLGVEHIELEMTFPDDYPFEPPFVHVVRPRFKRQTGFVMHGALCMELLTKEGWNPINDIESVIVSIRSLMVVGDGRLAAAVELPAKKRQELLEQHAKNKASGVDAKRERTNSDGEAKKPAKHPKASAVTGGQYTAAEAKSAYAHISDYHKKKGWDSSGWWAKKG
jgi:ubiquitin-conjugating enzyme E2 Q